MARYELLCILRADFDEEALEAAINRVTGLVATVGGTAEKVERWGKRHLAYPIQNRMEGYYILVPFTGIGTISNELTRRVNINEDVMRSIVVRRDAKPEPAAPAQPVPAPATAAAAGEEA